MQRVLLENYILEQIHLIERESYYNHDLLEESKIIDALKSLIPRSKIEAAAGLGILGLIFAVAANTENLSDNSNTAFDQVENQIEDAGGNTNNRNYENAEDEISRIMKINKLTFAELVDKYRINDPSLMKELEAANNNTSSKDASQSQTSEMFYNYMEGAFTDYTVADFNDMSQEDFNYIVDKYEKFLDKEAFKFTDKEYNQAMSLAFLLKSSDNYNLDSDVIKGPSDRLQAVHKALQTIDNLSTNLPDPSELSPNFTQKQLEQRVKDMVNGQIAEVEKLRDDLADKYNNPDNEEYYDEGNKDKLAMYDDMISQIEDRFYNAFGFELMMER